MTAHAPKPTLTRERVEWFARYYIAEPAWGVFHCTLDDGNWSCPAFPLPRHESEYSADVLEHARWFDTLTPSQRRRLGRKAEDMAAAMRMTKLSTSAIVREARR